MTVVPVDGGVQMNVWFYKLFDHRKEIRERKFRKLAQSNSVAKNASRSTDKPKLALDYRFEEILRFAHAIQTLSLSAFKTRPAETYLR